jgi:CHASE3 domain sensor protein
MIKVLTEMKRLGLKKNRHKDAVVFVIANNPDGACAAALGQICRDMRKEKEATSERNAAEIHKLARTAKHLIHVTKVLELGSWA